jgi:hypothetical protein
MIMGDCLDPGEAWPNFFEPRAFFLSFSRQFFFMQPFISDAQLPTPCFRELNRRATDSQHKKTVVTKGWLRIREARAQSLLVRCETHVSRG